MASTPDQNPDSIPGGPSEDVEQVSTPDNGGRESVEDTPGDGNSTSAHGPENSPGTFGGTAGTGDGSADSLVQDQQYER